MSKLINYRCYFSIKLPLKINFSNEFSIKVMTYNILFSINIYSFYKSTSSSILSFFNFYKLSISSKRFNNIASKRIYISLLLSIYGFYWRIKWIITITSSINSRSILKLVILRRIYKDIFYWYLSFAINFFYNKSKFSFIYF